MNENPLLQYLQNMLGQQQGQGQQPFNPFADAPSNVMFGDSPFTQNHPRIAGGIEGALLGLANFEPQETIGGNLSAIARGLVGMGQSKQKMQMDSIMAPFQAMEPMLRMQEFGMRQKMNQAQLDSLVELTPAQAARVGLKPGAKVPFRDVMGFLGDKKIDDPEERKAFVQANSNLFPSEEEANEFILYGTRKPQAPKPEALSDYEAAFQRQNGRLPNVDELVQFKERMAKAGRTTVNLDNKPLTPYQKLQSRGQVADDYSKELDRIEWPKISSSYTRIIASAKNPSPAGDLSMIFNYMKMLDPGSVVRESEFRTAAVAKPMLERLGLTWDAVQSVWEGKQLTTQQREDFLNRSKMLYEEMGQQKGKIDTYYKGLSQELGIPESQILKPSFGPDYLTGPPTGGKPSGGVEIIRDANGRIIGVK